MKSFDGIIKARAIEARFALSGKIAGVSKYAGDTVKKWDLIASLDRKILQTELDKELADYEKARADFDSFAEKYPNPQDDNKFTKAEKQATLNASVKSVELAKAKLDQVNLFSPIDGIIIDDNAIVPGLYITPAGSSVTIIDTGSYYFEIEVKQKEISDFRENKKAKIKIEGLKDVITGDSLPILPDGKKFIVKIPMANSPGIILGLHGKANF